VSAAPHDRPPVKQLGVFIADDSKVIRERLAELLATVDGVAVVGEATDVPSAQRGIQSTRPDVAILDIRMPGGSGIDVLRAVKRGQPGGPSFIMYTNYGLPQYRQACAEAGADFFFDKATDGAKLADAIRMLAARR
jgi:DNA-binding NarL/FixJ family response regulator